MIIANPFGRYGHVGETRQMRKGLEEAGFSVHSTEWSNRAELFDQLDAVINKSKDNCSVFFLFISSHGTIGHLTCSNGSLVPINDILHFMKEHLPASIPLVSK